jgi:hypothetical protein
MASEPGICDCCSGLTMTAPVASFARAGLSEVTMRSGTYWSFRDSMIARLSSVDNAALADLKSRDPTVDFSIALIDAWAVAGDILTFYNGRLGSETLIETARETESLHLLAQLVGYVPQPGVSASAKLAFTMSESPGAPEAVELASGIKVQSTPGPDEKPVTFETGEAIAARPAWNAIRPRLGEVQALTTATRELYLSGTQTGLRAGNALFFTADNGTEVFAYIRHVELLPADLAKDADKPDLTRISIDPVSTVPLSKTLTVPPAPPIPPFPPVLDAVLGTSVDSGELTELLAENKIDEHALFDPLRGAAAVPKRVLVFRQAAGTFGKTAPGFDSLPASLTGETLAYHIKSDGTVAVDPPVKGPYHDRDKSTWADDGTLLQLEQSQDYVYLDRVIEGIEVGSAVALVDGGNWGIYRPDDVTETSVADFAITGKSTRLKMSTDTGFGSLKIRGTTAFVDSEWLDLPLRPREDALRPGDTAIELEGFLPGLQPKQLLALTGNLADGVDSPIVEFAEISEVEHVLAPGGGTRIILAAQISQDFDRRAVRMNGNVAPATHGESKFEILGSGGSQMPFPTFYAKQGRLTHVSAQVPGGASPELTLRINGIQWHRVPNLLDSKPEDRVFTLALDLEGRPKVGFGDGITGALPSTGQDNITLDYRVGIGLGGRVKAGQLNMLMSRPLGLDGVTNPLPSEGGADPEAIEDLRQNIPLYCRTMDRVVSLSDFADFAKGFAGIAKARAERVKLPHLPAPGVVLTVAGEEAAPVLETGEFYQTLRKALVDSGIPFARFQLRNFQLRYFFLAAKILPHPDYVADDVRAAAEQALREAFSFEARDFAKNVFASQVLTVLQQVEGVEAALVGRLYATGAPIRNEALIAERATASAGAEILVLHPQPLDYLEVMS